MSRCILFGHEPVNREGVGRYTGRAFKVCARCGNLLDDTGRTIPADVMQHAIDAEDRSNIRVGDRR